ncbi:MAG: tRNA (guanosine(37)-N1)-methyltransferase TrmD [Cyanobacteria bacterium SIG30]|nr:tRNA (guanosine(37)-N1)-methyltransferase TrmD [Cyanobacteria bacterium SIG30]
MKFEIITLFEDIIKGYCAQSIIKRAVDENLIKVNTINPRDFTEDKHKKVDAPPYGGTAGMVLQCQPIFDAYESIEKEDDFEFIMLTPQGEKFNQKIAVELASKKQIIMLCGHYEGFDERIRIGLKPREISIGDYVLTGGELPALCLLDSISRNIKGVLGKEDSAEYDSFSEGIEGILEHPHYTRPREYRGMKVPEVLLNGNHAEIEKWRKEQRIVRTKQRRKDLLEKDKNI